MVLKKHAKLTVYILFHGITHTDNHTNQKYEALNFPEGPPLIHGLQHYVISRSNYLHAISMMI